MKSNIQIAKQNRPEVPLGTFFVKSGGSVDPKKYQNEFFDLYSIPAHEKLEPEVVAGRNIGSSKKTVQPQDVLLSRIVPHIRRAWVVDSSRGRRQIASSEWIVFRSKKLYPRYLCHYLISDVFHQQFMRTVSGVGGSLLRARPVEVAKIGIPLPSLEEQKLIAAILDKAEAIRRKRRQAIKLAEEFLRSVFLDMFGDPVLNPKGWRRCRFEDVLENINGGWSPKCFNRAANSVEWGVLKLGAVTSCQYIEHENKALPSALKPQEELEVKKGDLLFTRKNTYELVAACAYVYETRPKLMISDTIFRFKLRKNAEIIPEYLWALLTHHGKRRQLQSLAGGSAGSMPNISKARLSQQEIELPPFGMQDKFAKIFHKVRVASNKQLALIEKSSELFNSLNQRAFIGKLKQKTDFRL